MKCPKCEHEMYWFKEEKNYFCDRCYYKFGVDEGGLDCSSYHGGTQDD